MWCARRLKPIGITLNLLDAADLAYGVVLDDVDKVGRVDVHGARTELISPAIQHGGVALFQSLDVLPERAVGRGLGLQTAGSERPE